MILPHNITSAQVPLPLLAPPNTLATSHLGPVNTGAGLSQPRQHLEHAASGDRDGEAAFLRDRGDGEALKGTDQRSRHLDFARVNLGRCEQCGVHLDRCEQCG